MSTLLGYRSDCIQTGGDKFSSSATPHQTTNVTNYGAPHQAVNSFPPTPRGKERVTRGAGEDTVPEGFLFHIVKMIARDGSHRGVCRTTNHVHHSPAGFTILCQNYGFNTHGVEPPDKQGGGCRGFANEASTRSMRKPGRRSMLGMKWNALPITSARGTESTK